MKLDEITIHQFRGLKDVALKGLSRVSLLTGPNDSGKTSVLEAVGVFCRPLDRPQFRYAVARSFPGQLAIRLREPVVANSRIFSEL